MTEMPKQNPALGWSHLFNSRKAVREMYPSIWNIKVMKKVLDILKVVIKEGDHMLDVGAFNRNLKNDIEKHFKKVCYKSMDVDRSNFHDYYVLQEIEEQFDVVTMLECIEHLTLEEGARTLSEIYRIVKPGGILILSTPNTYHPNRYWECTHKVPFRYDEIAGFIEMAGFKTQSIYRIYNDSFFTRLFRLYIASYLHQLLNVDFAKSVLLIGKKPLNP